MFSKWRASIAGVYAWRAENGATADEKQRMADAADFAFRQAIALCPYSPEATARYADFLKKQNREADARLVEALAKEFQSAVASATLKASVFQMRLVLDAPTDNTELMTNRLQRSQEILPVDKTVLLDDTAIQSAKFDRNRPGYPEIEISLTDTGREQFAEITRQHLHQRIAMIVDGKIQTAPVIASEIKMGKMQITGSFSDDEGRALAEKINEAAKR
jgi:preprotein translocase subunit SecD